MKTSTKGRFDCMGDGDEIGKVFVGGLSWETTTAALEKYFLNYGEIIDCVVMKNQLTGRSRGFGFVTFQDPDKVVAVMHDKPHIINNRQVDPKPCNPRSLNTGGKSAENNKKKVFVGGLPPDLTDQQLKEMLSKFGPVLDAVIMFDHARQRTRGFGFVTFEKEESVDEVCNEQFIAIKDKQVEVKRAEPREVHSVADKSHLVPTEIRQQNHKLDISLTRQIQLPLQHFQGQHVQQSAELAAAATTNGWSDSGVYPAASTAPIYPTNHYTHYRSVDYTNTVTGYIAQYPVPQGYPLSASAPPAIMPVPDHDKPTLHSTHSNVPIGMLGNGYQQDLNMFGPALCPEHHSSTTGTGGSAYMNFSPQVTYTLTPGMTPVPGSVVMEGAWYPPPQPVMGSGGDCLVREMSCWLPSTPWLHAPNANTCLITPTADKLCTG